MARLIEPRPDPNVSADDLTGIFRRHGFDAEASELTAMCRALGLADADPLDPLREDHERVVEYVADELRKLAPSGASRGLLRVLAVHVLLQARRQGFRNWQPDEAGLIGAALAELARAPEPLSEALREAFTLVKNGPAQLKGFTSALFGADLVDPLLFLDVDALLNTRKRTGEQWNQHAHDHDPRLPDYWLTCDPYRAIEVFRRLFEFEPLETLGVLAVGLERQIGLQYPHERIRLPWARDMNMRELYPAVGQLAIVLCRRRAERGSDDRTLTQCCWSYSRLIGDAAPELLGELYEPLARLALSELDNLRRLLRGADAAVQLQHLRGYLTEAVFYGPCTDPCSLWPVLRRLLLALREVPHRGVPLDLRTWDEQPAEAMPQPWSLGFEFVARLLEMQLARALERDADLKELRREFAKFCIDRTKTREKARVDRPLTNEDFLEPKPEWRAAYAKAAKELHPNLGERGHHALRWASEHDPDAHVRDAARSAAEAIRHGHGLPTNTSPRRVMFAAFWWLRQAHVVSFGEQVDEEGAQRTFRKEMRRQASLEK